MGSMTGSELEFKISKGEIEVKKWTYALAVNLLKTSIVGRTASQTQWASAEGQRFDYTVHLRLHNLPSAQGKRGKIPISRQQIPHFMYLCSLLWTAGVQGRLKAARKVDGYNSVHSMMPAVGSRHLWHKNWRM